MPYMVSSAWVTAATYRQNEYPLLERNEYSAYLTLVDNLGKADIEGELGLEKRNNISVARCNDDGSGRTWKV
jgi:hypothetical protein